MSDSEYRRVVEGIVAESQRLADGQVDDPSAFFRRLAASHAEASSLAPAEIGGAWTAVAAMYRRTAEVLESDEPRGPTPAESESVRSAALLLEEHIRTAFDLSFDGRLSHTVDPPQEIPAEPAFVVPDSPVDEEEYARRRAALDDEIDDLLQVPDSFMAQLVVSTERIAEVAPLDLRPAWAVLAAGYRDIAAHGDAPFPGLTTVSKEQFLAATRIVGHAERIARQARPDADVNP